MIKTEDQIYKEANDLTKKVLCEDVPEVKAMSLAYNRSISDEAKHIHKESIIIDTCTFNLEEYNWHLEEGGLTGINCTVPGTKDHAGQAVRHIIDYYENVRDDDKLMMVYKADDIVTAKKENKVGVIIGSQSCDFVNYVDVDAAVEVFAKLGLRIMPIAYNHSSFAADGCYSPANAGITKEGHQLIRAMEKHGVTVDLSHVGYRSAEEAIDFCERTPVFTHSNPKALYDHPRNISDDLAKKCAARGGVIGVCSYRVIMWDGKNFPTIDDFVRCIEHYVNLVGVDHVGIGLDSNAQPGAYERRDANYFLKLVKAQGGTNTLAYQSYLAGRGYLGCFVDGIVSLANFPNIVDCMLKHGFKENEIKKILGENWLRIFRETWNNQI